MFRAKITFLILLWVSPSLAEQTPVPTVLDRTQSTLSHIVIGPIAWFDRFFMSPDEQEETNKSYVRIIAEPFWTNGQGFQYATRLSLKARLPALQNRLSLIIDGDDSADLPQTTADDLSRDPRPLTQIRSQDRDGRVALRLTALDWIRSRIDFDVALRSELRSEVSGRYRRMTPITQRILGRFVLKGFWLDRTGFGTTTRFEMERAMSSTSVLGWNNAVTQIASESGFDWISILRFDQKLSAKTGVSTSLLASGPTRPSAVVEVYRFGVLYRRNFHREWLFWEFEPWIERTEFERPEWETVPGAALRLEIQLRKLAFIKR